MASIFAMAGFFLAYLLCGGAALWLGRREKRRGDRDMRHGASGEQRVARTLMRAGYAVLTDLTVTWGNSSHQIDHIVRGRDRLFVIETKTWHGVGEGRAGDASWTLRRPKGRAAITAYNPLLQNRRHAEVIGAMCDVPVTPLVVSAGFVRVPQATRLFRWRAFPCAWDRPGLHPSGWNGLSLTSAGERKPWGRGG